jgi:hypothetical protein
MKEIPETGKSAVSLLQPKESMLIAKYFQWVV